MIGRPGKKNLNPVHTALAEKESLDHVLFTPSWPWKDHAGARLSQRDGVNFKSTSGPAIERAGPRSHSHQPAAPTFIIDEIHRGQGVKRCFTQPFEDRH
jgi:Holliday junction resolvasome RuvABC ATP-dependent DNA helicase subunit